MGEPFSLSIEHCFCHNSECSDHGKRGHGNVYFRSWSGRDKQIRMVYCRTCKKSYSERKGAALERSQLPTDKVVSVLDHTSARAAASAPPVASPGSPGTPYHATSPAPAASPKISTTNSWLFPP